MLFLVTMVKKKDTRATSINCVFMSINVVLVSFLWILDIFHTFFQYFYQFWTGTYHLEIRQFHYTLALNFSYHKEQQSIVNLLNHTVNKVTCSLKWALDECCWSYFSQVPHNAKDLTIFNNSFSAQRDYECQILLCQILFAFRHKNNYFK